MWVIVLSAMALVIEIIIVILILELVIACPELLVVVLLLLLFEVLETLEGRCLVSTARREVQLVVIIPVIITSTRKLVLQPHHERIIVMRLIHGLMVSRLPLVFLIEVFTEV